MCTNAYMTSHEESIPEIDAIRSEALRAGAIDPLTLRYRVVEYRRSNGELIGFPLDDLGFRDAVEKTAALIQSASDSHFCLEPVGFLQ